MAHCPFLLGNPQDIDGRIGEILFRRAGFEPKVAARSDNILTLLELCHYGMGACLCPERFLPALLDGERLRTLHVLDCGPETEYAIRFDVSATPYRWSVIDDFIRCAREVTTGEGVNDRGLSRKHIFERIDQTLKNMQTDYLDMYFCHRFDETTDLTETLRVVANELGTNLPVLSMAWILQHPEISCVIAGASKPSQLENNMKAAGFVIPADAMAEIDKITGFHHFERHVG